MFEAIDNQDIHMLTILIKSGADVNAKDNMKVSLLQYAAD